MEKENNMTQEDINKALDNLKARVKNMSNRELLENIYIMLQLNTLSTISANSILSIYHPINTRISPINNCFGNL